MLITMADFLEITNLNNAGMKLERRAVSLLQPSIFFTCYLSWSWHYYCSIHSFLSKTKTCKVQIKNTPVSMFQIILYVDRQTDKQTANKKIIPFEKLAELAAYTWHLRTSLSWSTSFRALCKCVSSSIFRVIKFQRQHRREPSWREY